METTQDYSLTQPSGKSYVVAVSLSSIFGILGIQHFYLRRYLQGVIDVGLTISWLYFFIAGQPLYGVLVLAIDLAHSLIVTILLLTGKFRDGEGRVVCFPGQKL